MTSATAAHQARLFTFVELALGAGVGCRLDGEVASGSKGGGDISKTTSTSLI